MKRTYIAIHGHTEFIYESEHRAGSAANMEDAQRAANIRFGRPARGYKHRIDDIRLAEKPSKKTSEKTTGYISVDLSLTDSESETILSAIAGGRITFIGAKAYGLQDFRSIRAAHGWSNSEFDRAVRSLVFRTQNG